MGLAAGYLLLQRYEIEAMLGQGGMGAVYRAHDQSLKRTVAVKERAPDPNGSAQGMNQARSQFRREAYILAQLAHPHLPHIYDYFSEADNEYIVMDLVDGENLNHLIQTRGAQSEALVLSWTRQILDALVYLHARSVIHRDVKPHNLILTPDDRIVLVDFGLVKLMDPDRPSTLTLLRGVGTPEYAPLEQYSREVGHTDPRSDIYSLGATLHTLLTGKPPVDVHARLLKPDAWRTVRDLNPSVSFGTESIVEKALGLYPQQRYQTALDMLQAFGFSPSRMVDVPAITPLPPSTPVVLTKSAAQNVGAPDASPSALLQNDAARPLQVETVVAAAAMAAFAEGLAETKETAPPLAPVVDAPSGGSTDATHALRGYTRVLGAKPKLSATIVRGVLRLQIGLGKYIEFVRVPAGKFFMGSNPQADPHLQSDELPYHEVMVNEFWVSKYPITVAQYTLFTGATNQPAPFDFPQKSEYPITNVSWYDAMVFCRWASDLTDRQVRLPTEAEWEKAARSDDGRIYPWGNDFDAARLNCAESKGSNSTPVGKYPEGTSPCGALDMAGNVWEWVIDWYKQDYYRIAPDTNPQGPDTGHYKTLRGGAWFSDSVHVRSADRTHFNPDNHYDYVGFRIALAAES